MEPQWGASNQGWGNDHLIVPSRFQGLQCRYEYFRRDSVTVWQWYSVTVWHCPWQLRHNPFVAVPRKLWHYVVVSGYSRYDSVTLWQCPKQLWHGDNVTVWHCPSNLWKCEIVPSSCDSVILSLKVVTGWHCDQQLWHSPVVSARASVVRPVLGCTNNRAMLRHQLINTPTVQYSKMLMSYSTFEHDSCQSVNC